MLRVFLCLLATVAPPPSVVSLEGLQAAVTATLAPCEPADAECLGERAAAERISSKGTRVSVRLGPLTADPPSKLEVPRRVWLEAALEKPSSDCDAEWRSKGLVPPRDSLVVQSVAGKAAVRTEPPAGTMVAIFEITAVKRKASVDAEMKCERRRQLTRIDGELSQAKVALSGVAEEILSEVAPQLQTNRADRACVLAFSPQAVKVTVDMKLVGGFIQPDL